jgi:sortase A
VRVTLIAFVQRLLFVAGVVALAYSGTTIVYAEFYQHYHSWKFDRTIGALELTTQAAAIAGPVAKPADLGEGDVIGKLEILQVGISVMVLQGTEEETLHLGAGHVPGTPLPGADGNSAIAGHRDTFFRKLEGIRPGDRIRFSTVRGNSEFVVGSTEIVEPDDTEVMESRGRTELTLITCYPFYFVGAAPHRFVVHAYPSAPSHRSEGKIE